MTTNRARVGIGRDRSALRGLMLGLLLAGAATGQERATPRNLAPERQVPATGTVVLGEITELEGTTFRIRPWNPQLPKRVQVAVSAETRYFSERTGRLSELAAGQLVLVVPDKKRMGRDPAPAATQTATPGPGEPRRDVGATPAPAPGSDPAHPAADTPSGGAVPPHPLAARALLQLWKAPDSGAVDDPLLARALLEGAQGFFRGVRRGGVDRPRPDERVQYGVFERDTRPRLVGQGGRRAVELVKEGIVVLVEPAKSENLKRKRTVMIYSPSGLAADGVLSAVAISLCPEPILSGKQWGRFYLREEGKANR